MIKLIKALNIASTTIASIALVLVVIVNYNNLDIKDYIWPLYLSIFLMQLETILCVNELNKIGIKKPKKILPIMLIIATTVLFVALIFTENILVISILMLADLVIHSIFTLVINNKYNDELRSIGIKKRRLRK